MSRIEEYLIRGSKLKASDIQSCPRCASDVPNRWKDGN